MFLARIEGTVVAAVKHATLDGCRFLVAQRLEADGSAGGGAKRGRRLAGRGDGIHGAGFHRRRHRAGAVRQHDAGAHGGGGHCGCRATGWRDGRRHGMRLGIVRGHVTLNPAVESYRGQHTGRRWSR